MSRRHVFTSIDSFFGPQPSKVMRTILQTIERIAVSDLGVLIVGEKGTGKEWLARTIHQLSGRAEQPFVSIDCTAVKREMMEEEILGCEVENDRGVRIIPGAFEVAAGGTVFFNKVTEILPALQVKLSRILEHQHFRRVGGSEEIGANIRIIATSYRKPDEKTDQVEERKEIYYRMCPIILNLPPLRERREDIPFLIEKFIMESTLPEQHRPRGITAGALQICLEYDWPGNARELRNVIDHALHTCSEQFIRKNHLPQYLQDHMKKSHRIAFEESFNL